MNLTPETLFIAARETLADPQRAARRVMDLGLSATEALMALALTASVATLLTSLLQLVLGPVPDPAMEEVLGHPFVLAISQFSLMLSGGFLMWQVGRMFGGQGTFARAVALVAWLEIVLILLQLVGTVAVMILPVLAGPISLASLFAFFYLLTHFTAALNGFTSLPKTFFAILGTGIVVTFVLALLLLLLIPVPHV